MRCGSQLSSRVQLSFADHVHDLDARNVALDRGRVGPALVDRDHPGNPMMSSRLTQETQRRLAVPPGRQKEIQRGTSLVDSPIEVLPLALDAYIGLVQPLAVTHRTLARQKRLFQQRHVAHDPAVQRGMIDLNAPLAHHLLELAVADRIRHIRAHTPQDDIALKVAALELDRDRPAPLAARPPPYSRRTSRKIATEPYIARRLASPVNLRRARTLTNNIINTLLYRHQTGVERAG